MLPAGGTPTEPEARAGLVDRDGFSPPSFFSSVTDGFFSAFCPQPESSTKALRITIDTRTSAEAFLFTGILHMPLSTLTSYQ
jgi:hypothetical protein